MMPRYSGLSTCPTVCAPSFTGMYSKAWIKIKPLLKKNHQQVLLYLGSKTYNAVTLIISLLRIGQALWPLMDEGHACPLLKGEYSN